MSANNIVILGGGAAGLALAAGLLLHNVFHITVIEKSGYDKAVSGEHLQSEAMVYLDRLKIPRTVVLGNSIRCNGITGSWGGANINADGLMKAYGFDFILQRPEFEKSLVAHLRLNGVTVLTNASISGITSSAVMLTDSKIISFNYLFDCTGRTSKYSDSSRLIFDKMIALSFSSPATMGKSSEVLIESAKNGWWYSVSNKTNEIYTFFTDLDIYKEIGKRPELLFLGTVLFREKNISLCNKPVVRQCFTSILKNKPGNIFQVGDAYYSLDPLSSQGIFKALVQAWEISLSVTSNSIHEIQKHYETFSGRFMREIGRRKLIYDYAFAYHKSVFYERRVKDYF